MEPPNSSALSQNTILFAKGVIARLAIWTTLRIAIQENWGGPHGTEKRTWLASEIVDTFETLSPPPDDQYIEEMLLQVMGDEFETNVEDGSAEAVSKDIVRLWEETLRGNAETVHRFEELAHKARGKKPNAQEKVASDDEEDWEDEDSEDGSEDEAVPELVEHPARIAGPPQVDEEGFTLVQAKKKK